MKRLMSQRSSCWSFITTRTDLVNRAFEELPLDSTLCRYMIIEMTHCW